MTIEEHIKKAMKDCPLTEEQEGKLLTGLENYMNEIEQALSLCGVSSSFSSESTHLCMAHLDKERTCMVCGKRNCC